MFPFADLKIELHFSQLGAEVEKGRIKSLGVVSSLQPEKSLNFAELRQKFPHFQYVQIPVNLFEKPDPKFLGMNKILTEEHLTKLGLIVIGIRPINANSDGKSLRLANVENPFQSTQSEGTPTKGALSVHTSAKFEPEQLENLQRDPGAQSPEEAVSELRQMFNVCLRLEASYADHYRDLSEDVRRGLPLPADVQIAQKLRMSLPYCQSLWHMLYALADEIIPDYQQVVASSSAGR
jgi:hypothetical protein